MARMTGGIHTETTLEADLTIRRMYWRYTVDLRFQSSDSEADTYLSGNLELMELRELERLRTDPKQYGLKVGAWLFGDGTREIFEKIEAVRQAQDATLRLRLSFEDGASELHRVRWEMARSPKNDRLLFVGENVLFSRYIRTSDFRRVQRRARSQLRALIAVASPDDLEKFNGPDGKPMARIDAAAEVARARAALAVADGKESEKIEIKTLPAGGRTSLDALMASLRASEIDILYLVCHGDILDLQPHLWLEQDDGTARVVSAEDFVARIVELRHRPSLIVLASCLSAGAEGDDALLGEDGVLATVGPRLAAEGIPAVLAMQGNVTVGTARVFLSSFFTQLSQRGQIDRAVSIARGLVRERNDAWAPVLFTRLKGGYIWHRRGWDSEGGFELMPALKVAIDNGKCTPIIGPGMLDNLTGSRREVASELAGRLRFPLSPQDRDELPHVAQVQSVEQTRDTLLQNYLITLCERLVRRYRDILSPELVEDPPEGTTTREYSERCLRLLREAWEHRIKTDPMEPYSAIAQLPFSVFVSTNADPLLASAIERAGVPPDKNGKVAATKRPHVELFRWSHELSGRESVFDADKNAEFKPAKPLVYHLYGQLDVPESLVLTQDDYFDALIAASHKDAVPQAVKAAFIDKTLLFLGFNIDDWHFRVLFRFIVNLPGVNLLGRHKHVAVQIDPEEQRFSDPRAARRYLSNYFLEKKIHIYWGTVDDFVKDLRSAYLPKKRPTGASTADAASLAKTASSGESGA